MTPPLGSLGLWRNATYLDGDMAAALEAEGCTAIWVGSAPGDLAIVDELLEATQRLTVATGIVNIWRDDAATVAQSYHRVEARHPGRFLLGVGVGHPEQVASYANPYDAMVAYLDALDSAGVPAKNRVLAALGPKVLRLAAERSAGAHPYMTPVQHTRDARAVLGPAALLAPELTVVVEPDPATARDIGRGRLAVPYLGLRNYVNMWRRMGFTDEDVAERGSDRLVDAVIAHGDEEAVAARIQQHIDAGADHVALQIVTAEPGADIVASFRSLRAAGPMPR